MLAIYTIEDNVCCGFIVYGLCYVEVYSFYAHFLERCFFFFFNKWMLNFVKSFLCISWDDHMLFIFQYVNMMYHIHWFVYMEESLHPWDKAHLIKMYDLFNVLDSVCWNFVEDFCIYVHQWYWSVTFFCVSGIFVCSVSFLFLSAHKSWWFLYFYLGFFLLLLLF